MNDQTPTIQIHFFASLRELIGERAITVPLTPGEKIADIKNRLAEEYPAASLQLGVCLVAVNKEYADDNIVLCAEDEVSFFPPVSGGMDTENERVVITDESLDANHVIAYITTPESGAACVFTGFVRKDTRRGISRTTERLEYEAYTPMAEAKMLQICQEMRERWPAILKIYMVQRVGTLLPGEVTIAIGCSSRHRDEGIFEAARYGIDRMKEIVPVWKKEIGPDGEQWVEGHHHPKAGE
jgi:molybdopterin synthase catalytic subunit